MRYFRNPDVKNLCLLLGLVTLGATIAGFLAGVGTGCLVLLVCLLFCGICLGHTLWRHRQMERLADYLRRITAGEHALDVRDNGEGELSILKSEIYKVTVMLGEYNDQLQAEKLRLYGLAREKAEALTQTRLKAFDELNARITDTLQFLNMPGVRMTLHHARGPLASHGQDSVEFYISTNAGEAPKPLARIASGGELSRITLAIKNALADRDAVPTVIYDEIDSGVSGKAAGRIGEVLRQSAQGHQILCITHTAQIAALADCHLLIQKNVTNDRTYTEIHPLDTEGRVEALARLISGDHVTELSRANAREMLQLGEA